MQFDGLQFDDLGVYIAGGRHLYLVGDRFGRGSHRVGTDAAGKVRFRQPVVGSAAGSVQLHRSAAANCGIVADFDEIARYVEHAVGGAGEVNGNAAIHDGVAEVVEQHDVDFPFFNVEAAYEIIGRRGRRRRVCVGSVRAAAVEIIVYRGAENGVHVGQAGQVVARSPGGAHRLVIADEVADVRYIVDRAPNVEIDVRRLVGIGGFYGETEFAVGRGLEIEKRVVELGGQKASLVHTGLNKIRIAGAGLKGNDLRGLVAAADEVKSMVALCRGWHYHRAGDRIDVNIERRTHKAGPECDVVRVGVFQESGGNGRVFAVGVAAGGSDAGGPGQAGALVVDGDSGAVERAAGRDFDALVAGRSIGKNVFVSGQKIVVAGAAVDRVAGQAVTQPVLLIG